MLFEEYKANISPVSSYGETIIEPRTISPRVCATCKKAETQTDIFKICRRCKQAKVPRNHPMYRHYCSKPCQVSHWKNHRYEHSEYERHRGPFLDNDKVKHYNGKIVRLRFGFDVVCQYNREEVLNLLFECIGKPNLLSVFAVDRGKFWMADMKDGPHVEKVCLEGIRHARKGYQIYRTFPCLLSRDELYPEEEHMERLSDSMMDFMNEMSNQPCTRTNYVTIRFPKHPAITDREINEFLSEKFSDADPLRVAKKESDGDWKLNLKREWYVNETLTTGLLYRVEGKTYITYPFCRHNGVVSGPSTQWG